MLENLLKISFVFNWQGALIVEANSAYFMAYLNPPGFSLVRERNLGWRDVTPGLHTLGRASLLFFDQRKYVLLIIF